MANTTYIDQRMKKITSESQSKSILSFKENINIIKLKQAQPRKKFKAGMDLGGKGC